MAVAACLKLDLKGDCFKGDHGPIEDWDVSSVTDMSDVFGNANSFNADVSKWDVSSVTDMNHLFSFAASFNGDISKWEVSSATDMSFMFSYAISFNGDISKWDVSRVQNMHSMFRSATLFNADISQWDVSSVKNMDYMFWYASSFNLELCQTAWVNSRASKTFMFVVSPGSLSQPECMSVPTPATLTTSQDVQPVPRRPISERELIVSTPVSTPSILSTTAYSMACPKCGTFEKSGRFSCCAPGGAWFKNCGSAGNRKVAHRWIDGVFACKRKFQGEERVGRSLLAQEAATVFEFFSLCFNRCAHINASSHNDDHRFRLPQMRHHREIWQG